MTLPRLACSALAAALLSAPLSAAPVPYRLDASQSDVGFEVTMNGAPLKGRMGVAGADITLDFDSAVNSRIRVTLDAAGAEMGLPFATEAMRSPPVLDTARFPVLTFESRRIRSSGDGATVEGDITIRDVTRPITFDARIFRPEGSQPGARDELTVRLTGQLSRAAFGAGGYPDLIADPVRIDIRAHILAAD